MYEGFRTTDDLIADAVERSYQWDDRLTTSSRGRRSASDLRDQELLESV